MTYILGNDIDKEVARRWQRCTSPRRSCLRLLEMVVQDIPDPPRNGLTPGLGVANHQQPAILDVLGVAVLGTLPGTALGPRNELNKLRKVFTL